MRINPQALRRLRQQAGHTGHSLAEASGVSQTRISELEAAAVPVRPTTARRLADTLGVAISRIAEVDDPADEPVETAAS